MVDVWAPYGNTEVCVRVPTDSYLGELKPKEAVKPSNFDEEILNSIRNPVGSGSLKKISDGKRKASIVLDCSINPSLSEKISSMIISELLEGGLSKPNVSIIVGCGLSPVGKGLIESFSKDFQNVLSTHDCYGGDNTLIGKTRRGTEVYVNKTLLEADLKIVVGKASLHPFAGFSGGRELILPGVCGVKSIKNNYALLTERGAEPGVLDDNPVHEDMMEAARMVGVDFCVNVFQDEKGGLIKVFSGDVEESFNKTVDFIKEHTVVPIKERADIIVVGAGGYPKDSNLSSGVEALVYASKAVKKGGVIILLAECSGGYGEKGFYEWMTKFKSLKDVEKAVKKNFEYGGDKAYCLLKVKELASLRLVSALPNFYSDSVFGLRTSRVANKALKEAIQDAGRKAKIIVIPKGSSTLPTLSNET